LARLKEPLVQVRGQWVELRPEQIEQALALFKQQDEDAGMALPDALRLALSPDGDHGLPVVKVETEGWIDDVIRDLRDGQREQVGELAGFVGHLRGYQKTGVSWLATMRRYGFGACLADDMGTGKTPAVIALVLHGKESGAASG